MKVLITGANGQLGQDFQKLFDIKGIDYQATGHELDIVNLKKTREFLHKNRVDVIINCAAYNAVDRAERNWKQAYLVNGIGPRNLSIVSNEIDSIFVQYSTDYVFDGRKGEPYNIFDQPKPISRYGESKFLGERFTQLISNKFYLIRTSWVFGIGNVNFPQKILDWSRNKSKLAVVDDQISSPTYTTDLAKATYDLIKTNAYGVYHITNSGYCSRYEWAEHILNGIGWKGKLIRAKSTDFSTQATRPKFSVLDNFCTKETIGYDLQHWKNATNRFLQELGEK